MFQTAREECAVDNRDGRVVPCIIAGYGVAALAAIASVDVSEALLASLFGIWIGGAALGLAFVALALRFPVRKDEGARRRAFSLPPRPPAPRLHVEAR